LILILFSLPFASFFLYMCSTPTRITHGATAFLLISFMHVFFLSFHPVGRRLFEDVICGPNAFLKNCAVVLVTHQLHHLRSKYLSRILALEPNTGRVAAWGSYDEVEPLLNYLAKRKSQGEGEGEESLGEIGETGGGVEGAWAEEGSDTAKDHQTSTSGGGGNGDDSFSAEGGDGEEEEEEEDFADIGGRRWQLFAHTKAGDTPDGKGREEEGGTGGTVGRGEDPFNVLGQLREDSCERNSSKQLAITSTASGGDYNKSTLTAVLGKHCEEDQGEQQQRVSDSNNAIKPPSPPSFSSGAATAAKEGRETGVVQWATYASFIEAGGGMVPAGVALAFLICVAQALVIGVNVWLIRWAEAASKDKHDDDDEDGDDDVSDNGGRGGSGGGSGGGDSSGGGFSSLSDSKDQDDASWVVGYALLTLLTLIASLARALFSFRAFLKASQR
jgi:hypothetical protein